MFPSQIHFRLKIATSCTHFYGDATSFVEPDAFGVGEQVGGGVFHPRGIAQHTAETFAVKNIVAEYKRHRVAGNKCFADDESFGDSARRFLRRITV